MTESRPFAAPPYALATCVLRAIHDAEDARVLSEMLVTMEPWRSLRYTTTALEGYLLREDAGLHRYVVEVQDQASGIVCVRYPWLLGAYLELLGLGVATQGGGVGSDIMRWLEDQTCLASRNVWALVSGFNTHAREFYARLGYHEIGPVKDLVEPGYDEILLRKVVR
jgi:ribosomal protein S18 acetylase RimI-like enzyme